MREKEKEERSGEKGSRGEGGEESGGRNEGEEKKLKKAENWGEEK